jgi:V/A-type H+-transporting ATPase subunit I
LSKERRELQKELNHLDFSQKSLIHRYENFLVASQYSLEKEIEVAEAPLRLGATENFFWVTGWTPDRRVEEITSKVQAATSERVHITVENPGHNDLVPIRLDNPRMIRPFEFFLDLYSLPKYDEIDPTFFIFLSFPLFFGFMLGDIGYGIVTLALFLFLSKRYPQAGLIKALVLSSISSILFGAVFGEFFGEELYHFVSREHDMMFLFGNKVHAILVYALILGIIHINISLVIGFLNELRHHGFRHAFLAKISWIIVEAGAALLIAGLPALIGGIVMLIGVSLIVLGEGATGLIELPAIFSNVLSYARLMALGLASVALAAVINEFSFGFFHKGGISILFGVLILVAGHGINIGLGILGPFLHSLRLHYVEFFSRFYKGGGRPYIPFGT